MSPDKTNANGYAPLGYPQPQYPPLSPQGCADYPHSYNHGVPPQGTACYASAQLPDMPSEPSKVYTYARIGLVLMVLFVFGSLALGVLSWLVFGNTAPEFQIAAFSVPYFNVTNHSTLKVSCKVNITAKNPTDKLEFLLAEIQGSLAYRGVPLGLSMMEPFRIGVNSEGRMQSNFSLPGPADKDSTAGTSEAVVRQMEADRKDGRVDFDLMMVMEATFVSTGPVLSKRSTVSVLCRNIRVNFPSPNGGGTWDGLGGDCLAYG